MNMPDSVLLVEDEAHIRLMFRKVFELMGIPDIREAKNGLEACNMYGSDPTDVVMMDINMPEMNGLDAMERILKADPDAIVVMLTSLSTRNAVDTSLKAGATYFIRKDTPITEMQATLTEVFERVFAAS